MSDLDFPPFIKWGSYKSQDQNKPDVLELQVGEVDTFETAYSINVKVKLKDNGEWIEAILPLQSFESNNKQLLQLWNQAIKDGKIKVGKKFKIKTWLGTSMNGHPIRRFELVF